MTISAFSDELAQVRTKKKEFLNQIERIVPWKEWLAMIQPCYYKGERGNKPYPLEIIFHVQRGSQISPKTTDLYSDASMLPRSTHAASHNNYTVKSIARSLSNHKILPRQFCAVCRFFSHHSGVTWFKSTLR